MSSNRRDRLLLSRFTDAFGSEMKRLIPGSLVRIFDNADFLVEVRDETPRSI